jgi:GTP-binding protein
MLQESQKACIILLNKWDLVRKDDGGRASQGEQSEVIRKDLFFLDYAPVVCISAKTGQGFSRIFSALKSVRKEADTRIPTGELNRFFRDTFEQHPPPSKSGKRFKLLYATQIVPEVQRPFQPPEFLLFVNDAELITDAYREYLFNQFRARWPFPGLPIRLRLKGRESREVQDRKKEGKAATRGPVSSHEESTPVVKPPRPPKPRRPIGKAGRKPVVKKKGRQSVAKRKAVKGPTGRRMRPPRP